MKNMRSIYLIFLGINIFGAIILLFSLNDDKIHVSTRTNLYVQTQVPLKFDNPVLAYQVLSKLDVFEPVDVSYFNALPSPRAMYNLHYLGLYTEDEYCDLHRAFIVDNPETIFIDRNFLLDYHPNNLVRTKVVPLNGIDLHEYVSSFMPKDEYNSRTYYLRLETNIFSTLR